MNKYNHWIGKLFGFFNHSDHYAVTFGQTTYFSCDKSVVDACTGDYWMVHENCHKAQYARDGWLKFLFRYCWQGIMYGYMAIDYEIEARTAAAETGYGPGVGDCSHHFAGIPLIAGLLTIAAIVAYFIYS